MSKTYFRTNRQLTEAPSNIKRNQSKIEGVTIIQMGEAKGHGVQIGSEMLDDVVRLGNLNRSGVKQNFGHATMCSTALGSFMGRLKNFSRVDDRVIADAFFSAAAKDAPERGNLHDYVFDLAESDPEAIGYSISFRQGEPFKIDDMGEKVLPDEPGYEDIESLPYATVESLFSADIVAEGAATESLFSGETVAGQISEFLNVYPDVFQALSDNPQVLSAIREHGEQVDQFIERYAVHTQTQTTPKKDPPLMSDPAEQEKVETQPVATEEQSKTDEVAEPTAPGSNSHRRRDDRGRRNHRERNRAFSIAGCEGLWSGNCNQRF